MEPADGAGGEATVEVELEQRGAAVGVAEESVVADCPPPLAAHGCGPPDDGGVKGARKHSISFWPLRSGVMGHGRRSWLLSVAMCGD
jgi:hypothetical protein